MASQTITCTASTYLNKNAPGTNYASAAKLYADSKPRDVSFVESEKKLAAVLQFAIPAALRYKRFTSARLRYYLGSDTVSAATEIATNVAIAPYITGNTIGSLKYNNLQENGEIGEELQFFQNPGGTLLNSWQSREIVGILTSNIYSNAYFTVIINTSPGASWQGWVGGASGSYPAELVLEYEDVAQLPPDASYPNNINLREGEPVLFAWGWNSTTQAVQASVQLEYKLDSAASYTVVPLTQETHSHTVDGLAAGTYQWRIKGTNDAGETSGYSGIATFTIIGRPAVPVINTPENRCITEITWNADGQNAYDIRLTDPAGKILVDESVSSGDRSFFPNLFLTGTYTVSIRVKNSMELWSDFGYKTFSVTASGGTAPELAAIIENDIVKLRATNPDAVNIAFLRSENGEPYRPLAAFLPSGTDDIEFIDETAKSGAAYTYVARAYSNGYTDSVEQAAVVLYQGAILSTKNEKLQLQYSTEKYLPYTENRSMEYGIMPYDGREYPVVEWREQVTMTIRRAFTIKFEEKAILDRIIRAGVNYYRDTFGNAFACVVTAVQYTRNMNLGFNLSIDLLRIAEDEVKING